MFRTSVGTNIGHDDIVFALNFNKKMSFGINRTFCSNNNFYDSNNEYELEF